MKLVWLAFRVLRLSHYRLVYWR